MFSSVHPAQFSFKYKISKIKRTKKEDAIASLYAKDELAKKILRHLINYDRKGIVQNLKQAGRRNKNRAERELTEAIQKHFLHEHRLRHETVDLIMEKEKDLIMSLFVLEQWKMVNEE